MKHLPLALGPLLALVTFTVPAPAGLPTPAWHTAGIAAWMALWWLTAVVPLEATALLPLVLFPLAGVGSIGDTASRYADPVIFLFLGGFLLAATIERWGLHRRFAVAVLRRTGTDARRTVLAMMLIAAAASMWVSNTATAVMLLPIATAVAGRDRPALTGALILGVAYGASIGGVATLIGTPPNALLAATASELHVRDVAFADWLPIGLACALPLLGVAWLVLLRVFGVEGTLTLPAAVSERPGPLNGGERIVLAIFAATAAAWVVRTPRDLGLIQLPGLTDVLPGLSDAGIAVAAGVLLLVLPLRGQRFATPLDWETAVGIPWGVLLLFGGGLALAGAMESSGLAERLGTGLTGLRGLPLPVVIAATAALFVGMTELTSNTATAALGIPLMAVVAEGLGVPAWPLMVTAALACSMAFMLPVATPPNAIAFGSGAVTVGQMARAGWRLNIAAVVVVSLVAWALSGG